jgi:hypothetical protein
MVEVQRVLSSSVSAGVRAMLAGVETGSEYVLVKLWLKCTRTTLDMWAMSNAAQQRLETATKIESYVRMAADGMQVSTNKSEVGLQDILLQAVATKPRVLW